MEEIKKYFIDVNSRLVHYRTIGDGPILILLHSSPQDGSFVIEPLKSLSNYFTLIALDSPGYGLSEALENKNPLIKDYALALIESLDCMGIKSFNLYGTHTGAHIALEVSNIISDRVCSVILDGISFYTAKEQLEMQKLYAPSFDLDLSGSHLSKAWHHTRDQVIFYPWFNHNSRIQNGIPDPGYISRVVIAKLISGKNYSKGYKAAFSHDTYKSLANVQNPTIVISRSNDILADQAKRFVNSNHNVEFINISDSVNDWIKNIKEFLVKHSNHSKNKIKAIQPLRAKYTDIKGTQRYFKVYNEKKNIPLLILYSTYNSIQTMEKYFKNFSLTRTVIGYDIPGNGLSDPLSHGPNIHDYADDLNEFLNYIAIDKITIMSFGNSAALALKFVSLFPNKVFSIIFKEPSIRDFNQPINMEIDYFRDLLPKSSGSHLFDAWCKIRDEKLFWPWFSQKKENIRNINPEFSLLKIHYKFLNTMSTYRTIGHYYKASLNSESLSNNKIYDGKGLIISREGDILNKYIPEISSFIKYCKHIKLDYINKNLIDEVNKFIDQNN